MHKEKEHRDHVSDDEVTRDVNQSGDDQERVVKEEVPHTDENTVVKTKNKINVKLALAIALFVVLAALLYSSRGLFIAATVNGSPISRMSVVATLEKTSGKAALETIITKKLIADEFQKSGSSVTTEEVDAEIKTFEEQVAQAGSGTLPELLAAQGMTMEDLRDQIVIQKQLEKLLAEKVIVSDQEVDDYISSNKLEIPEEQMAQARTEISAQLKQQKMSTVGQSYLQELRSKAKINFYANYQ